MHQTKPRLHKQTSCAIAYAYVFTAILTAFGGFFVGQNLLAQTSSGLPDFTIEKVSLVKNSTDGQTYFAVQFRNQGADSAAKNLTVEVIDLDTSDNYLRTVGGGSFVSGYVEELQMASPAHSDADGVYRIQATVDLYNDFAESDETNNSITRNVYAPVTVHDIKVKEITNTTATISWTANHETTPRVPYGKTMGLEHQPGSLYGTVGRTTSGEYIFEAELTGLQPATKYYFMIVVDDPGALGGVPLYQSSVLEFTTRGVVRDVSHSILTPTSVRIIWGTDRAYNCSVVYKNSPGVGDDTIEAGSGKTIVFAGSDNRATLENLKVGQTYYYRIVCRDLASNNKVAESADKSFELSPDMSDFVVRGIAVVKNVTDGYYYAAVDIENIGGTAGAKSLDVEVIDLDTNHTYRQSLSGGQFERGFKYRMEMSSSLFPKDSGQYRLQAIVDPFQVFVESNENNNSLTKTIELEFEELTFSSIKVSDVMSNSAVISWTTNKPATTNLQWGLESDPNSLSFTNSLNPARENLTTSHRVAINFLKPDTKYYYLIEGQGADGKYGGPGVLSFETKPESITGNITGGGHTVHGRIARIQWRTDGRYNCSAVFKGRADIVDDRLYPGAGISIAYGGEQTSLDVDLGALSLPNRESDRVVYYKIVCRDRSDGHKVAESDVQKLEWSAAISTAGTKPATGAVVQNDPEASSNSDVQALRERIKRLELRITELEREVVKRERQLTARINQALAEKLKGEVLLQVEGRGEAWYVDPVTTQRFYLKDGTSAYQALQAFGLGITNADLARIPVGLEERAEKIDTDGDGLDNRLEEALGTDPQNPDTDGDGFKDGEEVMSGFSPRGSGRMTLNKTLADKLNGRIVLQVKDRGQAWYIHDGKRYYLKDGDLAYQIMRFLSLGITNDNIRQIGVGELE